MAFSFDLEIFRMKLFGQFFDQTTLYFHGGHDTIPFPVDGDEQSGPVASYRRRAFFAKTCHILSRSALEQVGNHAPTNTKKNQNYI